MYLFFWICILDFFSCPHNQLTLYFWIFSPYIEVIRLTSFLPHHKHQRGLGVRGCLDQHQLMLCAVGGPWLAQHRHQWGLGAPSCLEQSRHILVLLGAPVSHTISNSEALLRADAWTSINSCLVLIGAPGWHNLGANGVLVRQGASSSLRSCLGCLRHLPGTPLAPTGPCCEQISRPALAHALCV